MSYHPYIIQSDRKSFAAPSTWPLDKYPDAPTLCAKSKVTILDASGPGIVQCIHSSAYLLHYGAPEHIARSAQYASQIILSIYYDNQPVPTIRLPFVDFLADVSGASGYFSTCYFSKVKQSHNFRLPIPFARHIRIELENPTDQPLYGYNDVQWEQLERLPPHCGTLRVAYQDASVHIPSEVTELCNLRGSGSIAAHWFTIQADHPKCANGEALCEANIEFYLDGAQQPQLNYLGTEDLYGFSWGFEALQSDHYCAIMQKEPFGEGAKIGVLRCRTNDVIRFSQSCVVKMDYTQEYFSALSQNPLHTSIDLFAQRGKCAFVAKYKSCYYYYTE